MVCSSIEMARNYRQSWVAELAACLPSCLGFEPHASCMLLLFCKMVTSVLVCNWPFDQLKSVEILEMSPARL